jgi:uncharacterized protein (DUF4213/DUF364 family)
MALISNLINTLPNGDISQVIIGLHWTAVVSEIEGHKQCGLASTTAEKHDHHNTPDVPDAGLLENSNSVVLASCAQSDSPVMRSVGVAAINSLIPFRNQSLVEQNAEQVIAAHGKGKKVVLVGRFPFIPRLKHRVRKLTVLEINPYPGELPETSAHDVIPAADLVAITGMSLVNRTFESLLELCSPKALVILLGPSAPLSPVLFNHGVDLICGSVVTKIEPVLKAVSQGANFRQLHKAGVQLVSIVNQNRLDE